MSKFTTSQQAILDHLCIKRVYINQEGYPCCRKDGRAWLGHRLIAQEILGVKLSRKIHVHHRDENRLNFLPSNLKPMMHSEHSREHNFGKIWVGRKRSLETKKLIAAYHLGRKHSIKTRKNISKALRGKKKSDTHKEHLRTSQLAQRVTGSAHPSFGKKHSRETRLRIKKALSSPDVRRRISEGIKQAIKLRKQIALLLLFILMLATNLTAQESKPLTTEEGRITASNLLEGLANADRVDILTELVHRLEEINKQRQDLFNQAITLEREKTRIAEKERDIEKQRGDQFELALNVRNRKPSIWCKIGKRISLGLIRCN